MCGVQHVCKELSTVSDCTKGSAGATLESFSPCDLTEKTIKDESSEETQCNSFSEEVRDY